MDSLAMFFGAKKAKKAKKVAKKVAKKPAMKKPAMKKPASKSVGSIMVRGRDRKVYKGAKGGLFYRSKGVKVYVDKKSVARHHRGDARRKTHKLSPHRKKKPAKKVVKKTKYGYGLGQPSLIDMMGPAGLSVMPMKKMSFGGYF